MRRRASSMMTSLAFFSSSSSSLVFWRRPFSLAFLRWVVSWRIFLVIYSLRWRKALRSS